MESSITEYIEELGVRYPGIKEVWFIGSRANGTARKDSDWDFIVFADEETFRCLREDKEVHRGDVDLLVVLDHNGKFRAPWGRKKSGSLSAWKWKRLTEDNAEYESVKWVEGESAKLEGYEETGGFVEKRQEARRIWPQKLQHV